MSPRQPRSLKIELFGGILSYDIYLRMATARPNSSSVYEFDDANTGTDKNEKERTNANKPTILFHLSASLTIVDI